ncbi:hypothetical protein M0G43_09180 [Subsaxibacter sp. CAU 1640]|uniref:hypothetical protein n=1 Tax=Subsaxibacter sp. CAU 1640 TaxID=2933271 RepID=UPI0020066164|nr:hypothetical protein [Subsaxibacter sp. CAU 1640]MCK7590745.1 hypothetical protein [Subsaxibacter sp. CAU 1640]
MNKYKTIEVNDYEKMLKEISATNALDFEKHDLFIFGSGGQDRKFYSELRTNPKYEVLWSGWSGPKWTKFLSFIPGQAGLVRILDQSSFYELYNELAVYSVSDAIYLRKQLTDELTQQVKNKTSSINFESFLENEPISSVLTSETNDTLIENGKEKFLYEYIFGRELNQSLKNMIRRKNEDATKLHL